MRRFTLLFALSILCHAIYAQSVDYCCHLRDENGNIIKSANVFVKIGKTDENGCFKINAKFNRNLLIEAAGYSRTGLILKADPVQRVIPISLSGKKSVLEHPESLKTEFEYPIYVVNGKYISTFKPYNYTDDQIAEITTTKKWNKVTKEIFKDTDIESIDVTKRGVVMVTTKEEITLNTPKNKMVYTVVVVDKDGKPIEGAAIYIRRGRADKVGDLEFSAKEGSDAIITSPKYEDYTFTLTEQREMYIYLTKKPKKDIEVRYMPSFNGGSFMEFRKWFMSYTREDLQKYIQAEDTSILAMFVVGRSGKVVCVNIIEQNNPQAARIVKNAIYRSPQWSPGIEDGKPVNVSYTLPVNIAGTGGY